MSSGGGPRSPRTKHSGRDPAPGSPSPTPHHALRSPQWGPRLGPDPCSAPGAGGPQVRELIDKVRAVFVETLDELRWMDAESKKKAQEKVGGR